MLEHLQPERVFYYFEKMCGIPHGSGNTKQISDFCVNFAREHDLEYHQDADNNVIIIKEAFVGYENAEPVILQGHLDMVCEKTADCPKDMATEGLDVYVDGDEVRAKDTTLGGDNGIAVAMALAILEDETLAHPRVEAVFTVDEEIGLLGAGSIDVSPLKGKTMINIDSEDEGIFTVSCAGGNTSDCRLPISTSNYEGIAYTLEITGCKGGHSGVEIDKGRSNPNVLMGRLLQEVQRGASLQIVSVDGGLKDNAIPVQSKAVIVCEQEIVVKAAVEHMQSVFTNEYATVDPDIKISLTKEEKVKVKVTDPVSTDRIVCMLTCMPNGIQSMSMDIAGLVQTSLNIGIVETKEDCFRMSFCVRSSIDSEREMLNRRIGALMTQLGGTMKIDGAYPGWEYKKDSSLRELMIDVFKDQYGTEPKVEAIHAGLECGMFAGKIPGLDCVSIGPDLNQIHTVRESMNIPSVQRVYAFVLEVLKRMK